MNSRPRVSSATDLLSQASQWRLLSLLLSRPTAERKHAARQLSSELAVPRISEAARAWCDNAEEGAYLHLLGPGGLVPAREVAYRPFADPGWSLADISRYHQAFGFHPAAEEPIDHIAVLADFVAYLLLKEAYACESADSESAAITRAAMGRFIDEHLVPVAARIADRIEACGAGSWSAAARLLAQMIPAPPPAPQLADPDEEVSPCGSCAAT
jgi:TorA maturation chaperone TorD